MTHYVPPGLHLLIDIWEAKHLQNADIICQALTEGATACGATLLALNHHSFGEDGGITAIAMLAESHISIHSWPEIDYAAIDIFTCGSCDPYLAIPVFKKLFESGNIKVTEYRRGIV